MRRPADSLGVQRPLTPDAAFDEADAVAALAALAQAGRLRIFRALVGAGLRGMTPGDLAAALSLPSSTLSFHLKELMHARLVTQERQGRYLLYRADLARMRALVDDLTAHCCGGEDCGLWPGGGPGGSGAQPGCC